LTTQLPHTPSFDGPLPGGDLVVGRWFRRRAAVLFLRPGACCAEGVALRLTGVFLLAAAFFLAGPPLPAQTAPHPAFHQYTTDDGLASSETYCIIQDRQGYIWISSDNGVSRFDGYEFHNYGLKDGLTENVIFVLQLDTLGRVWMQAMSGNLYYLDGETIRPYWNNGVLQNFKGRPDVSKGFIVEGAGETVHIATLKYGVITIDRDGATTTYPQDDPFSRQVFEKNGSAINGGFEGADPATQKDYQQELIRQKRSSPVYFHTGEGGWAFPDLYYSKMEDQPIVEAFRLGEGKYFFQMFHDVWFIENGQVRWQRQFPYAILHARLLPNGQLFVGLHRHEGLRVYSSIEAFQTDKGDNWLPGQSVSYFMEDREGGHWFATNENGVFYTPADAFLVDSRETGLPDEKVTALALQNERTVYVGLGNGEVWCLGPESERWTKLPAVAGHGFLQDLYFDQERQQLWTGREDLVYLQKNKWTRIAVPTAPGTENLANRITESPDGQRLWICNAFGFRSIELPEKLPANVHRGPGQRTYAVREDFSGRVWVGQSNGLYEWKADALHGCQNLHPAFSLRVEDIVLLPDSTLVVATKGGGLVFWKNGQFEQITTEQGLTANMLECLYADKQGIVWASTLNGLNRISGGWGQRQVEPITVFHGLPANEISRVRSWGETVWVATSKGLVHFSNKPTNTFSPQPILASVLANNHPLDPDKPIVLKWNENNLTIGFLALNYKMKGKIPYRYRMDGGDWAQTLNRSLNFPALPPGERSFELQAQNEDGSWSASTNLHLVIRPPWWASWWARAGAMGTLLLLGFAFYKYRTGQLKKAHQIQQQISDLERSALQAHMNPHFIFNCLNSIQNFILQNDPKAAILYLGNFASLVRSMLNASVAGKILLTEEVDLLNNYLALEKLRFKDRFTYTVRLAPGLDAFEVKIPPLLVQPYVENAVNHGIADKAKDGHVTVLFTQKRSYLEVVIEDNGAGMPADNGQPENGKARKSFGMSITRNRLNLLSGNQEPNTIKCTARYDAQGRVAGTQVVIQIWLADDGTLAKT